MIESSAEQHLFEMTIYCNIMSLMSLLINTSSLNKSIDLFH